MPDSPGSAAGSEYSVYSYYAPVQNGAAPAPAPAGSSPRDSRGMSKGSTALSARSDAYSNIDNDDGFSAYSEDQRAASRDGPSRTLSKQSRGSNEGRTASGYAPRTPR